MAEVELKNLTKIYDKSVHALNDLSIHIVDGAFVVLVGPSGCGKSTVLNLIAGIDTPTNGDIYIDGKSMLGIEPKDRDIAMVFQNYALYPHMNVRDNIGYSLKVRHIPKKERYEKISEIASMLDIEDLLLRKPSELSGGQKQRVALGRAIIRKPKVFLFDEPLSNLDAALRSSMRDELIRLHERIGTTFIYVTHDQVEAMTMGTQIVVMKDGVCQQCGNPKEIYEKPANQFVASFVGTPKMNFLTGSLSENGALKLLDHFPDESPAENKHNFEVSQYGEQGKISRLVNIGIRPKDITICLEKAHIHTVIERMEYLGDELLLFCRFGKHVLTVPAPVDGGFQRGDELNLKLNTDNIHMFDAQTELRINWKGGKIL